MQKSVKRTYEHFNEVEVFKDVSVIIPFYNSNVFINRAIESVLEQEYPNIEILVCVDIGSEKPVIYSDDQRIRIIQNTYKAGAGYARYQGILASKNEYIAFLDADDQWQTNKLLSQVEYMFNHKLFFSFTGYSTYRDENKVGTYIPSGKFNLEKFLKKKITVCCSTVMIRRNENITFAPATLKRRNDYQMWYSILQYLEKINLNYGYLPEAKTHIYKHNNNLSKNKLVALIYNYRLYRTVLKSHRLAVYYSLCNAYFTCRRILRTHA